MLELPASGRDWDAFAGYARDSDADSIVLDPDASLRPPATRPTDALPATVAPVGPDGRERPLAGAGGRVAALTTFAVSLLFYLALGDPTDLFDLVTGVATAALVAGVFGRVAFATPPTENTLPRLVRAVVVLPYLLWAVTKSSVAVAAVVLRPEMPIDPSIDRITPRTASDLERAVLANAITLTPGSLTVAVRDDAFLVHTLTAGMRAEVRGGRLERVVRWLFGDETTSGDRDVG
ncbi:Na+/H+ antiporter subunit E [Halobacteriaceae archaeon GCM10025711]